MDWFVLTVRALRWWPLAAGTSAAVAFVVAVRLTTSVPPAGSVIELLVATVMAPAVAAIADPADELLRAVPVAAPRRLVHRAGLMAVPTATAVLVVMSAFGTRWPSPHPAALVTLAGASVATSAVLTRWRGPAVGELAGLVPIAWSAWRVLVAQLG